MTNHVCATCGVQFAASPEPPAACPICEDERQYVAWEGQHWTTVERLREDHANVIRDDAGLTGIATAPAFAIGQRALLVRSPAGNVLWDCVTLLDGATVDAVRGMGGLRAIAISHPHYYSSMVEWAEAFDCPVFLHEADAEHVMRPDRRLEHWSGPTRELWDGMTLIKAGGHFAGGTVLHWPAGDALLAGDVIQVTQDRRWVSFMWSYPNYIPLSAAEVDAVAGAVEPFAFDRLYGAWWDRNVVTGASAAVRRSAERYRRALTGDHAPAVEEDRRSS